MGGDIEYEEINKNLEKDYQVLKATKQLITFRLTKVLATVEALDLQQALELLKNGGIKGLADDIKAGVIEVDIIGRRRVPDEQSKLDTKEE